MEGALIVSPHAGERAAYATWLRAEGYRVVEASTAADGIAAHHRTPFPLTLAELAAPAVDGVELIRSVRALHPTAEVLMMSAGDSVPAAVAAMKAGAADLLLKPLDRATLLASVRQLNGLHEVLQENARLRQALRHRDDFSRIVTNSPRALGEERIGGSAPSRPLATGDALPHPQVRGRIVTTSPEHPLPAPKRQSACRTSCEVHWRRASSQALDAFARVPLPVTPSSIRKVATGAAVKTVEWFLFE